MFGDVQELPGFAQRLPRIIELAFGHRHRVVVLHHHGHQPALRDVGLGARRRFGGQRPVIVGALARRIKIAMHQRLLVVDVRPVIRHKDAARRAVRLRIDELAERAYAGQQRRFGLHRVFVCAGGGEIGGQKARAVLPRAIDGLSQGELQRRRGRLCEAGGGQRESERHP